MPSTVHARAVVAAILNALPATTVSTLAKIWLCGSLVPTVNTSEAYGVDIDLILEIDQALFRRYRTLCGYIRGGNVHCFASNLLGESSFFDPSDEAAAKLERSRAALLTLGIVLDELTLVSPFEDLDIVCLPTGWDDVGSSAYQSLPGLLGNHPDPRYLEHLALQRLLLYPHPT